MSLCMRFQPLPVQASKALLVPAYLQAFKVLVLPVMCPYAGFQGTGGELSGGQTKEHAQLARSLGIEQVWE